MKVKKLFLSTSKARFGFPLLLHLTMFGNYRQYRGVGNGRLGGLKPPYFQALNIETSLFKLSKTHLLQQSSSCNSWVTQNQLSIIGHTKR